MKRVLLLRITNSVLLLRITNSVLLRRRVFRLWVSVDGYPPLGIRRRETRTGNISAQDGVQGYLAYARLNFFI